MGRMRKAARAGIAIACLLSFMPGMAYAADGSSSESQEVPLAAIAGAVDELAVLADSAEAAIDAALEEYLNDEMAKHAIRRELWERVQEWRQRFPEGDYSDVLFIGDSIMDESRNYLHAALPGCEVNADSGRTLEEGGLIREEGKPEYGVLDQVRADDGTHMRYVIGTGNNDALGMPTSAAQEIIDCLGPDKEIYFVTEMVTANPNGTANTNATIDAMVEAYPNVHKIDWHGFVEGRESELLRDMCHPTEEAKPHYAELVKSILDACYIR